MHLRTCVQGSSKVRRFVDNDSVGLKGLYGYLRSPKLPVLMAFQSFPFVCRGVCLTCYRQLTLYSVTPSVLSNEPHCCNTPLMVSTCRVAVMAME